MYRGKVLEGKKFDDSSNQTFSVSVLPTIIYDGICILLIDK